MRTLRTDEPLFRKVMKGQRTTYEPVSQYVSSSAFPEGAHLIVVKPGVRSTYYKIDAANADLIAASKPAIEAMARRINDACVLRQQKSASTKAEQRAFKLYLDALPKNSACRMLIGRRQGARESAKRRVAARGLEARDAA